MDSPISSLPNLGMVGLREAVQIPRSTRFCSHVKCSAGLLLVSSIRAFLLLLLCVNSVLVDDDDDDSQQQ